MNRFPPILSHNLLCSVTLAFAVGIVCSTSMPALPWRIASLALTGILTLVLFRYNWKKSATGMIFLFFVSIGLLFGGDRNACPGDPSDIYYRVKEKKEAVILGHVSRLQGYNGEMSRTEIQCEAVRFKDEKAFVPITGRVSLGLKDIWPKEVLPGDRILVRAVLSRPHGLRTAGSFDYVRFLSQKDIWITGIIKTPLYIYKTAPAPSLAHSLRYAVEKARMRIRDAIEATLPPEIAGIYKAVLIGDRSGISKDLLEKFKGSGCMHILAISGMHMSIIGLVLFSAFSWLLRRSEWLILHLDTKKAAALACLPLLCFYALLAGSNTPVMRSLLMSMAVLLALCVNRQKSIFATLALAMFCLLVWSPSSLFTVSFQLTFAAVAAIAAIFPFLVRLLPPSEKDKRQSLTVRLRNWLIAALAVSVAATVGTAPLLLFSFNRISLVGPLANLVVEPLICLWGLSLGFLACPCVFLFPPLASLLLRAGALGVDASIKSVSFFHGLPFASIWLPTPSPYLIAVYYGALLLLVGGGCGKGLRRTAWPVLLITLVCFRLPPSELLKHFARDSKITFIDVGQGSAGLLELPSGKRALIDCGGQASPGFNTGEQVVGPFLWKKGFTGINAVIITHPDADHYNGLPFILEHFRPDTLWINGAAGHDPGYTELLGLAKNLKIPIKTPAGDEVLLQAEGAEVSVIENPLVRTGQEGTASVNDRGLIVKFTDGTFSAIFPGDISKRVEGLLVADRPERLSARVLLAPHHGSSTSNSMAFLQAVQPEFLIVSAAIARRGVFPSRDLAEKAAMCGTKMLTTAMSGCLMVTTDGRAFSLAAGNGIVPDERISRPE